MLHKNSANIDSASLPPLALYIHIPWCVRKCPYCDFNSHESKGALPIAEYCEALIADLSREVDWAQGRKIESIFFGGGTPSLFPASAIAEILARVHSLVPIMPDAEITLEANPGASEYDNLSALADTPVNRLSFGAQSFQNEQLKALGRIHQRQEIFDAINAAKKAGFDNFNIDLMHGLPQQSVAAAMDDLEQALALKPSHLSWYQLTIEPNTAFYSSPPRIPDENTLADIQESGISKLSRAGFDQYEVSAFARDNKQSRHNLNYWQFGDYLAIGAGAHGKITHMKTPSNNETVQVEVSRFQKTRAPKDYLDPSKNFRSKFEIVKRDELAVEFMMNALRLMHGVDWRLFQQRTGLGLETIEEPLQSLRSKGYLLENSKKLQLNATGQRYLNDALTAFL